MDGMLGNQNKELDRGHRSRKESTNVTSRGAKILAFCEKQNAVISFKREIKEINKKSMLMSKK